MKSHMIVAVATVIVLIPLLTFRARIVTVPIRPGEARWVDRLVGKTTPSMPQLRLSAQDQSVSQADGLVNKTAPEAACCRISNGYTLEQLCGADGSIQISEISKLAKDQGCTCLDFFYCRLVVVTATSENHYAEAQDMIASVQKFLPNTKLIVYDIGMTKPQKQQLHKYCNVEVRSFQFQKYPPHTKTLTTYAWKPLIIKEVASRYEVIFWGDASARPKGPSLAENIFPFLLTFPFVAGRAIKLPIVSLTHDGMLKYLNLSLSRKQMGHFGHLEANCWVMWVNTLMKTKFLNYWVDCALHQECIAPHGATLWNCDLKTAMKKAGKFAGCHRYDQSALAMILIREFGLGVWNSTVHQESLSQFDLYRKVTHDFSVKKC